jgi:hypothetical protein
MAIGLRVGAVPAKVTVPVMDEAANATPGHAAAIIRLAARNTRVAVLRIVVSFVKVLDFSETLHRTRQAGNPPPHG